MTQMIATAPKQTILDAAQQLIMHHGYAGLSMRELSRQSGVAKGTIYHYFSDKQHIYLDVLERDFLEIHEHIAQAAQEEGDCVTRLRRVIRTHFELMSKRRFVIMAALREIGGVESQLRSLVQRHRSKFLKPYAEIIQAGIDEGVMRPVDIEMTILSLLGMMNGFVTHRLLFDDREVGDEAIEHTVQLFLRGVAK